jgi:hypothetical protein
MRTPVPPALVKRFERQIINAFRSERAVSASSAQRLRDLGLKDSMALRELVTSSVIRKAGPERFFLDEGVWAARRHPTTWHLVLVVVGVLLVVGLGALYLNAG